ncbi:uncharacterized protein LOC128893682 [Hylaeus anthracinus]|uniref:uncharacterized protein LOC128893682 n=1 Tax=Hylaeus anthracinus TaxID=313031 RepID=UPI0023B90B89|nr:uncharacterized protein LOC128893682 [Hylaeus anthracinus]
MRSPPRGVNRGPAPEAERYRIGWRIPTCVKWNGWSIVDVSFASATVSRWVSNWRVWEGETLSDHSYVLMDVAVVSDPPADDPLRRSIPSAPRWALKRLHEDLPRAVIIGSAWPTAKERGAKEEALWIRDTLQMICNVAMLRIREQPPRKSA